ncbi:hypothetical protein L0U85_11410 [Glycomyces sp. L485]|uniref:hypothetical protein n=1 Tax=Glycomyces sp. L485 TaxID=2909235 RepID=UPI001F4A429A|nr:hypothetical protein [Glycomyces sp. L485]MCH7231452.1 hypothetical protein [Glycomyces sp. L485]
MSNTPQPPADGWQPPQSPPEPPVYRPNEQPPTEEPPPWSPESQRVSPPRPQTPVEDVDGTVKYAGGPGSRPQAPFGPPPGVPVSPFDAPPHPHGGMPPVSSVPASGVPVSGMPPASGIPVSPGQGQFGPQGGQLVPVSGATGPAWGGAQPGQIQRKKKSGGKTPLWILLAGIVVIAAALGVGGFILFNPDPGGPDEEPTATIESNAPAEPMAVGESTAGLTFVTDGGNWAEEPQFPNVFTGASGIALDDGSASAFVGSLDPAALGATGESTLDDLGPALDAALAGHLGGEPSEADAQTYWVDAHPAKFRTFTVGETTVIAAIIELEEGYAGFAGFATGDQVETIEALARTLQFGEPAL